VKKPSSWFLPHLPAPSHPLTFLLHSGFSSRSLTLSGAVERVITGPIEISLRPHSTLDVRGNGRFLSTSYHRMSFRVKGESYNLSFLASFTVSSSTFESAEFHSRLDWEIGRGGFGKVYFGYRESDGENVHECACEGWSMDKQVAIKLEKLVLCLVTCHQRAHATCSLTCLQS
jgi:hypothetical protein